MEEAQELADRVAVITRGEIVALGKPHEIGGDEVNITRIRFTLPEKIPPSDLPSVDGEVEVRGKQIIVLTRNAVAVTNRITGWALEKSIDLENFRVLRPNLEEVYLALTGESDAEKVAI